MPTLTSLMVAASNPARWGFEVMDIVFDVPRLRSSQTLVVRGEFVRSTTSGRMYQFAGREGDALDMIVLTGPLRDKQVRFLPLVDPMLPPRSPSDRAILNTFDMLLEWADEHDRSSEHVIEDMLDEEIRVGRSDEDVDHLESILREHIARRVSV